MKNVCLLLLYFSGTLVSAKSKPINPIIGDQSYFMKYGMLPNDQTSDHDRIQTHVSYAEFLLRTKDVSGMSAEQVAKRNHTLDLLHEYWTRGNFPMNTDYATERQPCFIDDNGTICAVGYLVEQTAGRDVAELINQRHMYQTILEMNDPILNEWVKTTGLTLEECAIIQPSYGYSKTSWHVAYGISYRVNDNLYHTFEFFKIHSSSRWGRKSHSMGVTFDWLRHGNFSAGVKYSIPFRHRRWNLQKSIFIQPEAFQYNSAWGMNIRPGGEIWKEWMFFAFRLGYSYAIPIIEENKYGAGRHNFSASFILNLNEIHLPKFPKKPKQEDEKSTGV